MDRHDTLLPGQQTNFSLQVIAAAAAAGKPCVVVLISGGILSIDELVAPAPAIVDAFNPAQAGPKALAQTLFGLENRWGKLPVTIYPGNYSGLQRIQEMSLTTVPGRSFVQYMHLFFFFPFSFSSFLFPTFYTCPNLSTVRSRGHCCSFSFFFLPVPRPAPLPVLSPLLVLVSLSSTCKSVLTFSGLCLGL